MIDESLFSSSDSVTQKEGKNEENGDDLFLISFCMTFFLCNCIRNDPVKKKLKRKKCCKIT